MTPEDALKLAHRVTEDARKEEIDRATAAVEISSAVPLPDPSTLPTPVYLHERELADALRYVTLLAAGRNPFGDEPFERLSTAQRGRIAKVVEYPNLCHGGIAKFRRLVTGHFGRRTTNRKNPQIPRLVVRPFPIQAIQRQDALSKTIWNESKRKRFFRRYPNATTTEQLPHVYSELASEPFATKLLL